MKLRLHYCSLLNLQGFKQQRSDVHPRKCVCTGSIEGAVSLTVLYRFCIILTVLRILQLLQD